MINVLKILNDVKNAKGNNKISILLKNKDNNLLKEILLFTYNPMLKYNISDKKINLCAERLNIKQCLNKTITHEDWNYIKSILINISSKKGISNNEIDNIFDYLFKSFNTENREVIIKIILKNLNLGLDLSSFNKVWSDFMPLPQVMLAQGFKGKVFENAYLSRKFDGTRAIYLNGKFYSRTNKEMNIEPLKHILEQLQDFPKHFVLDGELVYIENGKEDFKKTLSLVSAEDRREGCDNIYYIVFDMVERDGFINKSLSNNFEYTYDLMNIMFESRIIESDYKFLGYNSTKYSNIYTCAQYKKEYIDELLLLAKKYNYEGLMLRDADKPYECKRTSNLLKIKEMQDDEFEIIGFKAGKGKYSNTLGSITIKLDTGETVEVGSGYSDTARDNIWENQVDILNKNLKLKTQYFEKSKDKKGSNSLRFPIALCFRMCDNTEISLEGN